MYKEVDRMTEGIRKTVTFEKEIHKAIQTRRGELLIAGVEKNFTEMVNELLKEALDRT